MREVLIYEHKHNYLGDSLTGTFSNMFSQTTEIVSPWRTTTSSAGPQTNHKVVGDPHNRCTSGSILLGRSAALHSKFIAEWDRGWYFYPSRLHSIMKDRWGSLKFSFSLVSCCLVIGVCWWSFNVEYHDTDNCESFTGHFYGYEILDFIWILWG